LSHRPGKRFGQNYLHDEPRRNWPFSWAVLAALVEDSAPAGRERPKTAAAAAGPLTFSSGTCATLINFGCLGHILIQEGYSLNLEVFMKTTFREALEALVNERIAEGADPQELFEELSREANLVFGHYNLEYELGLIEKSQ
jgi:hypothetical protein